MPPNEMRELLIAFGLGALSSIAGNLVYDAVKHEMKKNGGDPPEHTIAVGLAGAVIGGLVIYELTRSRPLAAAGHASPFVSFVGV